MNEKSFPMIAGLVALVLVVLLVISMSNKPARVVPSQAPSVPQVEAQNAPRANGSVTQSVQLPSPLTQNVTIKK